MAEVRLNQTVNFSLRRENDPEHDVSKVVAMTDATITLHTGHVHRRWTLLIQPDGTYRDSDGEIVYVWPR